MMATRPIDIDALTLPDVLSGALDGRPVTLPSPRAAADRGVVIIHQELSLFPNMSVADNLFMARERVRNGVMVDDRAQRAHPLVTPSARRAQRPGAQADAGHPQRVVQAQASRVGAHDVCRSVVTCTDAAAALRSPSVSEITWPSSIRIWRGS